MGKISAAVLLSLLFSIGVLAQNNNKAPFTNDYRDYLNHPEKYKDYIPHPFRVTFSDLKEKSAEMLPETFDLRNVHGKNYVSSVKDQGSYGTCWAFAASASIESYWMKLGLEEVTLSVRNFANCHGFEWSPYDGGNSFLASAYLSRLSGPVYESADPYASMSTEECITFEDESVYPAYISEMYMASGIENIKRLLVKYGAVATSMSTSNFYTHYNTTTYTYYYNDVKPIDHGVTIVGWNDNIVVDVPSEDPPGKGAWIIKNSWGNDWGNAGYFYVSYYDKYVGKEISLYPGRIETDEVDTLYLYDRLGAITSWNVDDAPNQEVGYAMAKYSAPAGQVINRIGTYINTGGTILNFVIAGDWDGSVLRDTLTFIESDVCRFPGYHSVPVSCKVPAGDFYVQIRYETPGYNWPVPIETVEPGFANADINPVGLQWISGDGLNWQDVGSESDNDFDLSVRAYAKNMEAPVAGIVPEKQNYCVNNEITLLNNSVGIIDSFQWVLFKDDETVIDNKISYDTNEPFTAIIEYTGFLNAKLIAYSPLGNDTITRYQILEVVNEPEIFMINGSGSDIVARNKPVTIIAHGADTYIWPKTSDYAESTGSILTFNITSPEVWVKVKGLLGDCETVDSLKIESVVVDYDDIKDAYELTINQTEGPFNNAYATVEVNEPAPEEGNCNNQIDWCTEGGLQHSIWFKFRAPFTGEVNIHSAGFDNQLALYDALATGSWQDIVNGNEYDYNLIAANDDAHESDYSAEIYTIAGLAPGKTYWLQMDGSAGGEVGEAMITVSTELPTISDYPVTVYPSFIVDSLMFDLRGMGEDGAEIKIFDLNGRIIYNDQVYRSMLDQTIYDENRYGRYFLRNLDLPKGIYIIEIKGRNFHYINKFSF